MYYVHTIWHVNNILIIHYLRTLEFIDITAGDTLNENEKNKIVRKRHEDHNLNLKNKINELHNKNQ